MNQKGSIKDIVIIVLGILLLGGGYFYFSKKPAYAPAGNINQSSIIKNEFLTIDGISFEYPSFWDLHIPSENKWIQGSDKKYEELKTPQLFVYVSDFYNEPQFKDDCSQIEYGEVCKKDVIDLMNSIEKETIPNIIKFNGGKGVLSVTCSGNEGWEGIPGPFYTFEFFKDDKKFNISLNDHSVTFKKDSKLCSDEDYIKNIKQTEMNGSEYEVYNDFIKLISTIKFTK